MDKERLSIGYILGEYLPSIPMETREAVIASVMKGELLEKAFSDPHGKMILEVAVDGIAAHIGNILKICNEIPVKTEAIQDEAIRINILREYLFRWANIYQTGQDHINKAKARMRKNKGE